jgi:hypothetical protein
MKQAREWLSTCLNDHSTCRSHRRDLGLPKRLIEVEMCDNSICARLVESCTLPQSTPYCTLSHCWGTAPIFSLLSTNIQNLSYSIPVERTVPSFRDAMLVVQFLGYRYLWIDSLCILQDSGEDWKQQAPEMGKVYGNAILNIAATGYRNGMRGLLSARERQKFPIQVPQTIDNEQCFTTTYVVDGNGWENHIAQSPLMRRAWVIQEIIMVSVRINRCCWPLIFPPKANRVLHFTQSQLYWECATLTSCEAFPRGYVWQPRHYTLKKTMNMHSRVCRDRLI